MSDAKEVGDGLREAVFGANDGIVSTFGILTGLVGAAVSSQTIIIVGLVQMFAAGMSMGLGAYISTKSQNEYYFAEKRRETVRMKKQPSREKKKVERILAEKGLKGQTLKNATRALTNNRKNWLRFLMEERYGIADASFPNPVRAGIVMFCAFVIAGFIALFPFFFSTSEHATLWSVVLSLSALFAVGAIKTKLTEKNFWESGFENLLIGAVTGVVGFGVGYVVALLV